MIGNSGSPLFTTFQNHEESDKRLNSNMIPFSKTNCVVCNYNTEDRKLGWQPVTEAQRVIKRRLGTIAIIYLSPFKTMKSCTFFGQCLATLDSRINLMW